MAPPTQPRDPSMDFGDADGQPEAHDVGSLHAPIMREKQEPRDGYEPVPLWLVGLFGVILFWGGWYLATYSGGWRGDILDHDPAARYATTGAAATAAVDPMALGERIYRQRCVSCHQASGQGVPNQYPPLAGSEWVLENEWRLKRILLHGMEGPVTVKGNAYNGAMPAFGAQLKDEQLAAVLTYIRRSWGNDAAAVAPEQVAATRDAVGQRPRPWSAPELLALTQPDASPATPAPAAQP